MTSDGEIPVAARAESDEAVVIDSAQELAGLVDTTTHRVYGLQLQRRPDIDPDDNGPVGEQDQDSADDGQAFEVDVGATGGPDVFVVRVQVSTKCEDGSISIDLGVQFHWEKPVKFSQEVGDSFASETAIPFAVANASSLFADAARMADIQTESLPFELSIPGRFTRGSDDEVDDEH